MEASRSWRARLRERPWEWAAAALAVTTIVVSVALVVSPFLSSASTLGFHDWDVETSHRYLTKLSLLRYGEAPLWNPFACGGFPEWGYIEGGTIVVSPWLLPYLVLPIPIALRVEVIGMALLSALGAYALAGRFTRSFAGRALVVALWAVNGRWALQAAAGHTWHLAYAWMPWCFYFFERARADGPWPRMRNVFGLGACFAMLVYSGGIYPLPHTVLALGLYALALSARERSARPLLVVAASGLLGVCLAAPKLLPMLQTFERAPRTIESVERLAPGELLKLLTLRAQDFHATPFRGAYGWHEYGMYLSVAGLLALVLAIALVWGRRVTELKLVGLIFVLLGFGAFHPAAPWSLLHAHAPFFRSQHVPFRFLYPAALLLALVAARGLGRLARRKPWLDAALGVCVLALAVDVALVARKPMAEAMCMVAPPIVPAPELHFTEASTYEYAKRDFAGPVYLSMLGNKGIIHCYGFPPLDAIGARSVTDVRYRGEAYVLRPGGAPAGEARITSWSPNHATLSLEGASAGTVVVYNMNFDEGWRSDAGPVAMYEDKLAVRLDEARSSVSFSYRPASVSIGVVIAGLTAAACALVGWARLRGARRARRARAA